MSISAPKPWFYFQPPWGYHLKKYRTHQSVRQKVLEQVEIVLCSLLGNVVHLSPVTAAIPPDTHFSHISGFCLPDFTHKVVPIPRQVCGVQGNEVIRGFAPFSLAPSQEEVLWVGRTAHQNQLLVSD